MEIGQFIIETTNETQHTHFVRRIMKVKITDLEVHNFIKM